MLLPATSGASSSPRTPSPCTNPRPPSIPGTAIAMSVQTAPPSTVPLSPCQYCARHAWYCRSYASTGHRRALAVLQD
eukprot:3453553-Rhodomonas_salina.1